MFRVLLASVVLLFGCSLANVLAYEEACRNFSYSVPQQPLPLSTPTGKAAAAAYARYEGYVKGATIRANHAYVSMQFSYMLIRELVIVTVVITMIVVVPRK